MHGQAASRTARHHSQHIRFRTATRRRRAGWVALLLIACWGTAACDSPPARAAEDGSVTADSPVVKPPPAYTLVPEQCAFPPPPPPDTARLASDSAQDSARADSARAGTAGMSAAGSGLKPDSADSAATHKATGKKAPAAPAFPAYHKPAALPGSLFPGCRVIAYYGNPLSKRMGILGELPPAEVFARLTKQVDAWRAADSSRPALPALELIATVAQPNPGKNGLYRLHMSDSLVEKVARWAEQQNALLILDVQVGKSSVDSELAWLKPWLSRPYAHLALDPEFSMKRGGTPGQKIGTMDAKDVNAAITFLGALVDSLHLPPKMLIVHRFTRPMLTHHTQILTDPRVQVVIDMDGFGAPWLKRQSYRSYVASEPVQFTGFKIFYKNDKPMLTPAEVLKLRPVPLFIMYQ